MNKTRIKIVISVFGERFDPDLLTKKIGIKPSETYRIGDKVPQREGILRKVGNTPIRKETAWEYSTEYVHTLNFEDLSNVIVDEFKNSVSLMNDFIMSLNLKVKVFVVIDIINEEIPSLYLNKKFISMVNRMGAEVDVDMYLS